MALPALSLEEALKWRLEDYFEFYGRYIPDAPRLCYAIRVGSHTLRAEDSHDLRVKLGSYFGVQKRKLNRHTIKK